MQEGATSNTSGLDGEKALALVALAALSLKADHDAPLAASLRPLMHAASWVTRARAHHAGPPISPAELVTLLKLPVSQWLRGAPDEPLIEEGEPTALCLELAEDAGPTPLSEMEQAILRKVVEHLRRSDAKDAQARYVSFRETLINAPVQKEHVAAKLARTAGVDFARLFEPIRSSALLVDGDQTHFFPCPRCQWPMTVHRDRVSCARSVACLKAGARFKSDGKKLRAVDKLAAPAPVRCDDHVALLTGIWRFTTLPGLEELALAAKLKNIPNVEVALWPLIDAYDLHVRRGNHEWRVDVKDRLTVMPLARELAAKAATHKTWIVVPDAKADQVTALAQLVDSSQNYLFVSSSGFVDVVSAAT